MWLADVDGQEVPDEIGWFLFASLLVPCVEYKERWCSPTGLFISCFWMDAQPRVGERKARS